MGVLAASRWQSAEHSKNDRFKSAVGSGCRRYGDRRLVDIQPDEHALYIRSLPHS